MCAIKVKINAGDDNNIWDLTREVASEIKKVVAKRGRSLYIKKITIRLSKKKCPWAIEQEDSQVRFTVDRRIREAVEETLNAQSVYFEEIVIEAAKEILKKKMSKPFNVKWQWYRHVRTGKPVSIYP
jgi:hypothetical protein